MMIIGGRRYCGKTTELVKVASEKNLYIVCANTERVRNIVNVATDLKLDIPFPITVDELPLRSHHIQDVLVDDLESVLYRLIRKNVLIASTSFDLINFKSLKE